MKFLSLILVLSCLLVGCGNKDIFVDGQDKGNSQTQSKGQQKEDATSSGQTITLSDCIPLEDVLALNHRDGGGDYRYMDPIPEEYWNIKDSETGVKGIAVQYDGKMYQLYVNGKIVDEAGNVKQKAPQDQTDEESVFTAWVMVLREDDMLGHDAVYNNMSYDIEKAMTVDELRSLMHVVYITPENFDDYFTFIEVEEEREITGSKFEENHIYKPHIELRIAYKGPGYLLDSGSFVWKVDAAISYIEKYSREECDSNWNIIKSYTNDPREEKCEIDIDNYEFEYQKDGEYRDVSYSTVFMNFDNLLSYYANLDTDYYSKSMYAYEDITVHNAQGFLIYCEDIPEEYWNVTEKGNRYVCVKREDKPAWRFCEYGRIGADNKDVDAYLEATMTDTIDGSPKEIHGDILSINGNDLSNFVGIKLESLPGYNK